MLLLSAAGLNTYRQTHRQTTTTTSLLYPIIHVRMDNKMSKNEHKHIYRCLRLRQQSLQHDILCLQFAILSQAAGLNSNLMLCLLKYKPVTFLQVEKEQSCIYQITILGANMQG